MADVMGAFLQGRGFAQAETEHKQLLEENKLRTMVLKHQIDSLKIDDRLRQRAIEQQNFEMMQGQPDASMPADTTYTKNLPATGGAGMMTGLPGVVSSLIQARNSDAGAPMDPSQSAPGPSTVMAPTAQAAEPQYTATRTRRPMKISGVPEMGIGDLNITPRSAEDIIRASLAAKMMEPYNLSKDQSRFVGGTKIATGERGTPNRIELASRAVAGDPGAAATLDRAFPSRNAAASRMTPKDFLLDGEQESGFVDGQGTYYDAGKNPIKNPASRIKPLRGSATADANVEQRAETAQREDYKLFARSYRDQHPIPKDADFASAASQGLPPPEKPPAPPSYDKWKVMNSQERQGVIQNPGARITDAEMAKRQATATAKPGAKATAAPASKKAFTPQQVQGFLQGQPKGKRYTMTDGTQWDYLPDGSIKPVQ